MVINLSNVSGSLVKNDQKRGKKLKLTPFLTESIISLGIFNEHLRILLESKNSYLCQRFRLLLDIAQQKPENMLKSYL